MRHTFTLACAVLIAIIAWSGEATAASRIKHNTYSERTAPIGGTMDIPVLIARSR